MAEEVIRKNCPLKLPSRVHLQLWNTPEISQFRNYQNDVDESEKRRATIRQEQHEIGVAAREARTQVLPNMDTVSFPKNKRRVCYMCTSKGHKHLQSFRSSYTCPNRLLQEQGPS